MPRTSGGQRSMVQGWGVIQRTGNSEIQMGCMESSTKALLIFTSFRQGWTTVAYAQRSSRSRELSARLGVDLNALPLSHTINSGE